MENTNTCFALIPAYEPGAVLIDLARQLKLAGFSVVIIDDGSGPGYDAIFNTAKSYAAVLSYPDNCGKGHALKTGLSYIAGQDSADGVVITLDSDGQHRVEDVIRVGEDALARKDCLVLGSRRFGKNTPARSQFGNSVTRFVFRLSSGKKVYDTQTGLRAFGCSMIPLMCSIQGERYEYEMNVLLNCARRGISLREIEIETVYFDNNSGSHFNTFTDSFRVYGEIIKFAASSFTGFLVDYGLYSLLVALTAGLGTSVSIPISNISARIVSATVNYSLNRKFVFKNEDSAVKTMTMYFVLAACILAGNTFFLSFLVGTLHANKYLAKIITEITFFTASWLFQKYLIFRKKSH